MLGNSRTTCVAQTVVVIVVWTIWLSAGCLSGAIDLSWDSVGLLQGCIVASILCENCSSEKCWNSRYARSGVPVSFTACAIKLRLNFECCLLWCILNSNDWLSVVAHGCPWLPAVVYGCLLLSVAIDGYPWLSVAVVAARSCLWLSVAIYGYPWLSVVVRSCLWLTVVVRGCLSPSLCLWVQVPFLVAQLLAQLLLFIR